MKFVGRNSLGVGVLKYFTRALKWHNDTLRHIYNSESEKLEKSILRTLRSASEIFEI